MNTGEDDRCERLWAVFSNDEEGYTHQITAWKPKEEAENALTALYEGGETDLFLAAEDG